jgi:hypothetical protein
MAGEFNNMELLRLPKKEGTDYVLTVCERVEDGKLYIDVREEVTQKTENGFKGWTKRGVSMPIETFTEMVKKSVKALKDLPKAS